MVPVISVIFWKEDASLLAMFNQLYSSTNQQLFEKNFCNQSIYYEITDNFCYEWKPSHDYYKIYTSQWAMNGRQLWHYNRLFIQIQ